MFKGSRGKEGAETRLRSERKGKGQGGAKQGNTQCLTG